ncbi:ArsR family transcriptional regulator [Ktedonosporobacter rubrisoli]|uniref:ArsR family transcriptional regulator n=1 Tax=Ktedonosporobacter rubrisoli TaxID=2509675 RepID=A0A4P6JT47_KTERU|nr:metalloregulator ArsR/SmtB family transcription factor [Ktedonosporobacter rubrisoli]QBD78737.1 ArsR family transcriptional regulator [Ktedonosporobacter rubrisoli]
MNTREPQPALALIAGVLSDPTRLQILDLLVAGPDQDCEAPRHPQFTGAMCPQDLLNKLQTIAASKLSYHLGELQRAGLIHEQRYGKRIYYVVQREALQGFLLSFQQRYLHAESQI